MSKYSKINFIYFMQKWMDSVPGQTFLNYAYSWGAAIVILGTLFKLTHLPGANVMLFIGMGTEVFVFFISAFDRPFDKSTIDMTLDNHMADTSQPETEVAAQPVAEGQPIVAQQPVMPVQPGIAIPQNVVAAESGNIAADATDAPASVSTDVPTGVSTGVSAGVSTGVSTGIPAGVPAGGTIIIGGGVLGGASDVAETSVHENTVAETSETKPETETQAASAEPITFEPQRIVTPAPAVSPATAEAMEAATTAYVERLEQLNETLQKVEALSSRLATDSEEMENLNRTLTGIARVYEMQLKSASQQITTQDSINEQTRLMADKIKELNSIYARMIEAMTVNMPGSKLAN